MNSYTLATILMIVPQVSFAAAPQLHSVVVTPGGDVEVTYSKSAAACAHLKDSKGITHKRNYFCGVGNNITTTVAIDNLSFRDGRVRLCGGNSNQCSPTLDIQSPAHPLNIHIVCDLAETVANELGESFDCNAPSATVHDEIAYRFAGYVDDLNAVYAKNTHRSFSFDGATNLVIGDDTPFTNANCDYSVPFPDPFGRELYAFIGYQTTGSSGGYVASACNGRIKGLGGLKMSRIFDPSTVTVADATAYYRGWKTIAHEYLHVFNFTPDHYAVSQAKDETGVEPRVDLSTLDANDPYWSQRDELFSGVMLSNITALPTAVSAWFWSPSEVWDRPTLLGRTLFSPLSAVTANGGYGSADKESTDLNDFEVQVLDATTGQAIVGATVRTWKRNISTQQATPGSLDFQGVVSNSNGVIVAPWGCSSCLNNVNGIRLIKASAPGYEPEGEWFLTHDAQLEHRARFKNTSRVVLRLTPTP